MNWLPQAYQVLTEQKYDELVTIYEQALSEKPEDISLSLYLGLAYLLNNAEAEAQEIWFYVFANCPPEELEFWQQYLGNLLTTQAQHQENSGNLSLALLLRYYLQEIAPDPVNNYLAILNLGIELDQLTPASLDPQNLNPDLERDLLLQVCQKLLNYTLPETLNFLKSSIPYLEDLEPLISSGLPLLTEIAYRGKKPAFAAEVVKIFLTRHDRDLILLNSAVAFAAEAGNQPEALAMAETFYDQAATLTTKLYGNYLILFCLLRWGIWQDIELYINRNKQLLAELLNADNPELEPWNREGFLSIPAILPYLEDRAVDNRKLTNLVADLFCQQLRGKELIHSTSFPRDKLRIGYIGRTLKTHSVGWLSRWLIKYHNREQFEIGIYLIGDLEDDVTQTWFKSQADFYHNLHGDAQAIAEQIRQDQIDILVDLDSLTYYLTCQVLAYKPSPLQVTWLGWDGGGLPCIDYYLADPYVLPANAQTYYREKIWRLPHTYVAVDGFEIGIPTLRRTDLGIAADTVVYLSVQSGLKRHPDTIRQQLKILHGVENSCFLIKGLGDRQKIRDLFTRIAQEEGVNPERLYFLEQDKNEATHRANLALADVILDTYPYNGATTTLEALWQEIPLVTRVGEQFAARNSYTFLINAGVKEAIATNAQEYVDWGIRLGKDKRLREQIAWQLRQGKQSAPLWDSQSFTQEVEKFYRNATAREKPFPSPE